VKPRSELGWTAWRHPIHAWHQLTRSQRSLPDLLIIGAQKSGTTSLYHLLAQHPRFLPAKTKEIHYFDKHPNRPVEWYRACFPLEARMAVQARVAGGPVRTGEATPSYLFGPPVPDRVADVDDELRLVAVLRDPVDRAYSHYHHNRQKGRETLDFEAALAAEEERIGAAPERAHEVADDLTAAFYHFSYRARGIYVRQLEAWLERFDEEQLFVVGQGRLGEDPDGVLDEVAEHVGLPSFELQAPERRNTGSYDPMDEATREELAAFFEPYNEQLFDLLGRELDW
jgi:catechol 2,3-dioxygenase-like lactoylglutathione lyase family enzyme